MDEKPQKRDYMLPASILIAALLISGSLIYNVGKRGASDSLSGNLAGQENNNVPSAAITVKPFSSSDHILGNKNAPIKIIEFSDLECPYCKEFHKTMKQVMTTYGEQVAWAYRHFPLYEIHPRAPKEAEASECANELGGNNAFWAFIDRVFEVTPSNNGLDPNELPAIAKEIGLDETKFNACLASGKYQNLVSAERQDAEAAGGRGTPYSIIVANDGKQYVVNGALPFDQVKMMIDAILKSR